MNARTAARDDAPPAPGRRERLARRAHALGLLPLLQRARRWLRRDLRVLAYHRVRRLDPGFAFDPGLVSATPDAFAAQMRRVRDRYRPVRVEDVVEAIDGGRPLPRDAVLVTFDDGYDDNHDVAFPILRDLGVPALFFVATGHIDNGRPYAYDWLAHLVLTAPGPTLAVPALRWSAPLPAGLAARADVVADLLDQLKALDDAGQQAVIGELEQRLQRPRTQGHADCRPMDWAQLRAMRAGGMAIGAHGVHHRMLAKLPQADMVAEVREAKARLDAELGEETLAISYPVGGPDAFDDAVEAAAAQAGFRIGFSYINGRNDWPFADRYALRRTAVERTVDAAWFDAALALPELFTHPTAVRAYPA